VLGALWGGLLLVGAAAGGDDLWQPLRPFAGGGAAPAAIAADDASSPSTAPKTCNASWMRPRPVASG
jgi:hypothetical protein